VAYVGERKQFGRPIGDNQYLQFKLAEMATSLVSARCVIFEADKMRFNPSTVVLDLSPSLALPSSSPIARTTCLTLPSLLVLCFHADFSLMIRHAASLLDAKDPGATMAAAMAKKTATDIGFQVPFHHLFHLR
jgi:alkylation response protein AidB-like acyl-CoA dehydrogenase